MKHVDVVPLHDKFPLSQLIGSVIACLTFFWIYQKNSVLWWSKIIVQLVKQEQSSMLEDQLTKTFEVGSSTCSASKIKGIHSALVCKIFSQSSREARKGDWHLATKVLMESGAPSREVQNIKNDFWKLSMNGRSSWRKMMKSLFQWAPKIWIFKLLIIRVKCS